MLTSKKVVTAINKQIGNEFGASMQYIAIAAYFSGDALPQLAQHFYRQAAEENDHAMRFIKYLIDAGGRVVIPAIGAPQPTFKNAEEAIKLSLDQEIEVTHQINALVELARSENDFITNNFLQWFLTEQLEEVSSMDTLLKIVQRGADNLLSVEEYLARVGVKGAGPGQHWTALLGRRRRGGEFPGAAPRSAPLYSTVTLFARFRGLSTSRPSATAR